MRWRGSSNRCRPGGWIIVSDQGINRRRNRRRNRLHRLAALDLPLSKLIALAVAPMAYSLPRNFQPLLKWGKSDIQIAGRKTSHSGKVRFGYNAPGRQAFVQGGVTKPEGKNDAPYAAGSLQARSRFARRARPGRRLCPRCTPRLNLPPQPKAAAPSPSVRPCLPPGPEARLQQFPDALGVGRVVAIDTTGGPGFGFEHFKQLDFLQRQGSRADVRRRSVAGEHAGGAEGAGRRVHHRDLLPDRQARDLLSGNPQAGRRGGPHRRLAHLVARQSHQQEADRRSSARKKSKRVSAP